MHFRGSDFSAHSTTWLVLLASTFAVKSSHMASLLSLLFVMSGGDFAITTVGLPVAFHSYLLSYLFFSFSLFLPIQFMFACQEVVEKRGGGNQRTFVALV